MGMRNLRAICPNCGGKIHTQPKGLGHFTWANSWMLVQTGSECQHCGVALSGKVAADNKAILAEDADKTWRERETGAEPKPEREYPIDADELFGVLKTTVDALGKGPALSRWQRFKNISAVPAERRVSFDSDLRCWEISAHPTDSGSRLSLNSRRRPGAFTDWGERKRVEKKLLMTIDDLARIG